MNQKKLAEIKSWLQDERRGTGLPDSVSLELIEELEKRMRNTGGGLPFHVNVPEQQNKNQEEVCMSSEVPVPAQNRDIMIQILNHPMASIDANNLAGPILETLEQIRLTYEDPEIDCIVWDSSKSPRGFVQITVLDRGEDEHNPGPNVWISRARFEDLLTKEKEWADARTKWHGSPAQTELSKKVLSLEQQRQAECGRADLLAQKCADLTTEREVHLREMVEMRQTVKDLEFVRDELKAESRKWFKKYEDLETKHRDTCKAMSVLQQDRDGLEEDRSQQLGAAWVAGYQEAYQRAVRFMSPEIGDFLAWEEKQK